MLLYALLCAEIVARIVLEVRECRQTGCRFGVLGFLRLVPLVNDIVPLPERRSEPPQSHFVKFHEEAHRALHHAVLRNLVKIVFLMCAVWFLVSLLVRMQMPIWQGVLWLHLVAIPFRTFFHYYCWNQEHEADRYALSKTDRKVAKVAMRDLSLCEIPHTRLFALIYREHPPVALRRKRLLNK